MRELERFIRKCRKTIYRGIKERADQQETHSHWGAGVLSYDPSKSNVLIVTPEASVTESSLLVWNIAKKLSNKYNVTVLSLAEGAFSSSFREVCVDFWVDDGKFNTIEYYREQLLPLFQERAYKFSIVNSVDSRYVLEAIRSFGVVTVSLNHEFASEVSQGREAFSYIFNCANAVVFPADVTMRNALSITGYNKKHNVFKLAPGRCETPTGSIRKIEEKSASLESLLCSEGVGGQYVVIGVGCIEYKSGVDLFLNVASKVVKNHEASHVRFVWIGAWCESEEDTYSGYIKDQIDRAGLTDRVEIIPPSSDIIDIYELADTILLTGRLDALPNVAIDALSSNTPVLCFDRTTGIVGYLESANLHEECVASYLDTEEMAQKLLKLATNSSRQADVRSRINELLSDAFCMDSYVRNIESIAYAQNDEVERQKDFEVIMSAACFRSDFYLCEESQVMKDADLVRHYLEGTKLGLGVRRPEPGFNSTMYLESLHGSDLFVGDPYAEFLRRGRPAGPWLQEVLSESAVVGEAVSKFKRVALHIHVHYVDVLEDVFKRLSYNEAVPDVFITLSENNSIDEVLELAKSYHLTITDIVKVPNIGRDVGPFLTDFLQKSQSYDIVGHLHTKKSLFTGDDSIGKKWSDFLFENLLGGEKGGAMLDKILTRFHSEEAVGMVYPSDPNIVSWTQNDWIAEEYAQKMGFGSLPNEVDFPIGTMFWSQTRVLQPFIDLNFQWCDYPKEPIGIDGTILHALERLFGYVPYKMGFKTIVTNVKGVSR